MKDRVQWALQPLFFTVTVPVLSEGVLEDAYANVQAVTEDGPHVRPLRPRGAAQLVSLLDSARGACGLGVARAWLVQTTPSWYTLI